MTSDSRNAWKEFVESDLGVKLSGWQSLSGGDFASSFKATVTSASTAEKAEAFRQRGTKLFIKTHASPPPHHFTTEAQGLRWLAQSGTVRVAEVLGVSDEMPYLALGWIEQTQLRHVDGEAEREFGRQLANLHLSQWACFGREDHRTTGSQGLPNEPHQRWTEFYATQRLLPLAKLAATRQALSAAIIRDIENLAQRLDTLSPMDVKPSLLHGDLWAGNRLIDANGKSWIIDPASHGGHREFDLAMMRLFGGFGEDCFAAYREVAPLDPGWQERVSLHQLAPLIVHAIKFGRSYVTPTREALAKYV